MNTIKSKKKIHIHFIGLQPKEQTVFDRVIAFNKTHGLNVAHCDELASANLVVVTEAAFAQVKVIKDEAVVLMITQDKTLGDVHVSRPLLLTRVMKALESAIKHVDGKVVATITQPPKALSVAISDTQSLGYHALVIDDSAAIRKQIELELRTAGISADFAESGEQALEKIKENSFDLIFLDVVMPGIDGYQTCKLIRANEAYKKIPILMLSGKTSPLDEVQGIIAGATTYLTKPIKSTQFQETLSRITKWINNFSERENKKKSLVT